MVLGLPHVHRFEALGDSPPSKEHHKIYLGNVVVLSESFGNAIVF